MPNPRWRERREVYLRESGRTTDLMREGFNAGKLDVVEGGGHRQQRPRRQLTLILIASAAPKTLSEQKDYQ